MLKKTGFTAANIEEFVTVTKRMIDAAKASDNLAYKKQIKAFCGKLGQNNVTKLVYKTLSPAYFLLNRNISNAILLAEDPSIPPLNDYSSDKEADETPPLLPSSPDMTSFDVVTDGEFGGSKAGGSRDRSHSPPGTNKTGGSRDRSRSPLSRQSRSRSPARKVKGEKSKGQGKSSKHSPSSPPQSPSRQKDRGDKSKTIKPPHRSVSCSSVEVESGPDFPPSTSETK